MKSVQIRRYFQSVFSCIRTKYGDLLGKYGPEITPYLDTCHAVYLTILKTLCIIRNYVGLNSPLMNKSFNREHVLRRSFIGVSIIIGVSSLVLLAMTLAVTHMLNTVWKVSKYGVFSCPYFSIFGLNTEIYSLNLRIQSEYMKIRTRKTQ